MTLVRLSLSALTFVLLYWTGVFCLLLPLVSWLVNLCLLLVVSWSVGTTVARKYVLPRLPQTDTKQRAVIVTGCDSGFGYYSALKLNEEGFYVFATVINDQSDGASKLKKNARHKDRLQVVRVDVTKDDDIRSLHTQVNTLIDSSDNSVNQLFGLVNNAGILLNRAIEFAKAPSIHDFERMFEVNTYGVVRMTRMFLPLIRKSKGRIVNVSSQVSYCHSGYT